MARRGRPASPSPRPRAGPESVPAAPYRHFRDRDALLADVARRGFERFPDALARAWNDGKPDPLSAFENVDRAYLAFARAEPAYYAAMFEAPLPPDTSQGPAPQPQG